MFRQLIQSKEMHWRSDSDDSDGDVSDEYEDDRLEDEHYEREADRQYRKTENRLQIAAENRLQIAAADRFKRLQKQMENIDNNAYTYGGEDAYIADMIGSIDTAKESELFQQLLELRSILKEYLTARYRTPSEMEGLDEYWNKYPCTIWDGVAWVTTKHWDFYCTDKRGPDGEYVKKYIKRAHDFLDFLVKESNKHLKETQRRKRNKSDDKHEEKRDRDYGYGGGDRYGD
jgi:hypothetical protein